MRTLFLYVLCVYLRVNTFCVAGTNIDAVLERLDNIEKNEIATLKDRLETAESRVQVLEEQAELKDALLEKLLVLFANDKGYKDKIEQLLKYAESLTIPSKQRRLLGTTTQTAFHAVVGPHLLKDVRQNQAIIFDTARLNIGGDYHENLGVFIAPTSGIYVFSASIASAYNRSSHEFDAALMKNGEVIARLLGHGDNDADRSDQASVTVTVQLVQDDEVWVKLTWPVVTELRGDAGFSSFTGFRLG